MTSSVLRHLYQAVFWTALYMCVYLCVTSFTTFINILKVGSPKKLKGEKTLERFLSNFTKTCPIYLCIHNLIYKEITRNIDLQWETSSCFDHQHHPDLTWRWKSPTAFNHDPRYLITNGSDLNDVRFHYGGKLLDLAQFSLRCLLPLH